MTEAAFTQRYELLGEISRGGMGVVYRALDNQLGREVAIKVMLGEGFDVEALQRFQREAQVLASLKHPNIVPVYDFGWHNNRPYLVMALLSGQSLESLVKQRIKTTGSALELAEALDLLAPIAEALARCHERGIIHRDLKPSNIFIEQDSQRPVLLDFGLVKVLSAEDMSQSVQRRLTKTGELLGTPDFMAPEQFELNGRFGEIGPRVDVWGLVSTLYFALTGAAPFAGDHVMAIYKAVTTDGPRAHGAWEGALPPELLSGLNRMFLKLSAERPEMEEAAALLRLGSGALVRPRSRLRIFLVLALLLLVVGVSLAWLGRSKPREAVEIDSVRVPEALGNARCLVKGRVRGACERVIIDCAGQPSVLVPVKAEGLFEAVLRLPEGRHVVSVRAEGARSEVVNRRVRVDLSRPTVVIQSKPTEVFVKSVPIDVEFSEAVTVTFADGRECLFAKGLQTLTLDFEGFGKVAARFQFEDAVGHKGSQTVQVLRRRCGLLGEPLSDMSGVDHHYKDLNEVLEGAPNHARVLVHGRDFELRPDFVLSKIKKTLTLEGVVRQGQRPRIILRNVLSMAVVGGQLTVRDLICEKVFEKNATDGESLQAPIFVVQEGSLVLDRCVLKGSLGSAIDVGLDRPRQSLVTATDCVFEKHDGIVIVATQKSHVRFKDCIFRQNRRGAVKCDYGDVLEMSDCRVVAGYKGVSVRETRQVRIQRCQFVGQLTYSFWAEHCEDVQLSNVEIQDSEAKKWLPKERRAVLLDHVKSASLSGLRVRDVRGIGIHVLAGEALTLKDCQFRRCGYHLNGAVLFERGAKVRMHDCLVAELRRPEVAEAGSASIYGLRVLDSALDMTRVRFSSIEGVALSAGDKSRVRARGCIFENNEKDRSIDAKSEYQELKAE